LYKHVERKCAAASKAEEYRRQAEEAEAKVKTTRDLSASRMYEELARHYRYLTEQQDKADAWTLRQRGDRSALITDS
jgi:hypothetical protein